MPEDAVYLLCFWLGRSGTSSSQLLIYNLEFPQSRAAGWRALTPARRKREALWGAGKGERPSKFWPGIFALMIGTEPCLATGGAARARMGLDHVYFGVHRYGVNRMGDGEIRQCIASPACRCGSKISISTLDLLLSTCRKRLRDARHLHILQQVAASPSPSADLT